MIIEAGLEPITRTNRKICRLHIGQLVLVALCSNGVCAFAQSTDSSADKGNSADWSSYRAGCIEKMDRLLEFRARLFGALGY